MQAVRFHRYGEPGQVLSLEDVPVPAPRPDQMLIRLTARPVNPSDLLYVRGRYGRAARFPAVAGFEGVGVVTAASALGGPPEGTRVAVSVTGTWQEYIAATEEEVIAVPDDLPDETACQLTVNPPSARLLLDELALRPGEWLLLTAGASSVSRMIIDMARQRRVRCLPLVRRQADVRRLREFGAREALDTSHASWPRFVQEITGGGAQAAIDSVGGPVGRAVLDCLRPGGQMIVFGLLADEPLPCPPDRLIFHSLSVRGFWLPERLRALGPEGRGRLTDAVVRDLVEGRVRAPVAARHDLAEVHEAVRPDGPRDRWGKTLLTA
ncbi:zinc-dependent alcohol dehydrogenase family protein [Spongiactinospora sp. 9N601]|uniref:zinc-dependent alcohol dehydrogenase family protein n=1 Tax=Spongiactinospora sp. 9N601 TaxID=3375149 RepID=UPI0037A05549